MFHNAVLYFNRGFAFLKHAPLGNLSLGSNDSNLAHTWLFRTHPYIRQGTFARVQLGTDERKSWSHVWATEYTNHSLNSAVPEFCVDCVQETVMQITLIITQPVEGLLDKTEN